MTDTTEKMAADIAMTLNGGEWNDGKWYSKDHQRAWTVAVKPHADKIDTLRDAAGCGSLIIRLMCEAFEIEPEEFVVNLMSDTPDGERKTVKKVSAQQILDQIRAALGEKES